MAEQPLAEPTRFDPHFKIFHELMAFKVREILLVSSPYDAYIMEEDGSLASRLINEYHGLNLSHPPRITRVETAENALRLLENKKFDLVVTMPRLGGMDCCVFGDRVKKLYPHLPVVLLAHSVKDAFTPDEMGHGSCIDNSYVWCCDSDLLLSIVKNTEDKVNVDHDTQIAMVRVILLVEDSAQYRSSLLPILYHEVVQQTQSVLNEGLNEQHRLLKMRARPKILTASSYEEAMELYDKYKTYVYAVMSDIRFPRKGKMDAGAGLHLVRHLRKEADDLPLLLLSTETKHKKSARRIPAVFIDKMSSRIQEEIHDFFLRYLGFGHFVFRMPNGTEINRAANLFEFEKALMEVPLESLSYHASHNHFSNWVMARAEIALASRLDRKHGCQLGCTEALREDLLRKVHALRRIRQQGVIQQFRRGRFDPEISDFVRIGSGSMGGKARGIAFISSRIQEVMRKEEILKEASVKIPRTCVVATGGFDEFIESNNLQQSRGKSDEQIESAFLQAALPDWLVEDLRAYLGQVDWPLAVRSSSMLEDAQFRPYAGLYGTFMLQNNDPDFEKRLQYLLCAVKRVYASTWFEAPRSYSKTIGQTREDSMAVIIQQLAGRWYGEYFYPAVSGVVQSYNYYPVGEMKAEEGIAQIALGFGRTVVEGEQSLRFSPVYPQNLPQFSTVDDILTNSQRWFYSLPARQEEGRAVHPADLTRREVDEAFEEFPVWRLSSTYIPEEHRIRDHDLPGPRVMTFAPLLKYDFYPLPELLNLLARVGREGMGCEIEVEFSLDIDPETEKNTFYFLQIRPIVTTGEAAAVTIEDKERQNAILCSDKVLGHGRFTGIRDIVFVSPSRFDSCKTRDIAKEIGQINRTLHKKGRPYLLIGPGRWGTADPWLGIPVLWSDISGVAAMVELQGYGLNAELSQGSHFFQNITSLGIPYLMVPDTGTKKKTISSQNIDWQWIRRQSVVTEKKYVSHVRIGKSLTIKVDGHQGEAVCFIGQSEKNK